MFLFLEMGLVYIDYRFERRFYRWVTPKLFGRSDKSIVNDTTIIPAGRICIVPFTSMYCICIDSDMWVGLGIIPLINAEISNKAIIFSSIFSTKIEWKLEQLVESHIFLEKYNLLPSMVESLFVEYLEIDYLMR